ncbi:MAG: proline--tRNA ligase [Actinomycetota bacterium]
MRMSQLFARTLRDAPADAEAVSHKLLVRAAMVRQLMSGVYTFLPLGLRVLRKIERIIREEMDASGAQEITMPVLLPAEPWRATGRLEAYGELMFKLRDRHERELVLGPTEEEIVTPLVAGELGSYRDLPVNLYQSGLKYRDESRPRYGLLRAREFLMKDAYSFDRNEDDLHVAYRTMTDAYDRIFTRCALEFRMVEADPGTIGGDVNHEFMALADAGEDEFLYCENGDYAADVEAATSKRPEPATSGDLDAMQDVSTPGRSSIAAVAELLERPETELLKTMLFDASGTTVAVLLPGNHEVNEEKVARALWPSTVRPLTEEEIAGRGFVKGYTGPQGLPEDVTVLADPAVAARRNWIAGANRADFHATGVNEGRDFRVDRWEDVVRVSDGDPCPIDGGTLHYARAMVVGHTYELGTRYSVPLKATFVDEDGTEQPYVMGSYGIGLPRVMAAVAEQFHDDGGLRWPKALAPYAVVVIVTNRDDERAVAEAERIYGELQDRGVETVLDDREVTAGVKFADADLIGFPVQVVVGKRGVAAGTADLKLRATGDRSQAPLAEASDAAERLLAEAP